MRKRDITQADFERLVDEENRKKEEKMNVCLLLLVTFTSFKLLIIVFNFLPNSFWKVVHQKTVFKLNLISKRSTKKVIKKFHSKVLIIIK